MSAVLTTGVDCAQRSECSCFACNQDAVTLNVFDAGGLPLPIFIVDATLDGVPVDTTSCNDAVRLGSATCAFGSDLGVYRVTVQAEGFKTRQVAARFATKSGEDCCMVGCLGGTTVNVVLEEERP